MEIRKLRQILRRLNRQHSILHDAHEEFDRDYTAAVSEIESAISELEGAIDDLEKADEEADNATT